MKRYITILLFFVLLPYLAFASTSGKIKGKVTDITSGEPLIGANILVLGTSFGAATDINGSYTILNLDAGTYEVRASFVGYQTVTYSNIRVNTDLTTELNFQLPGEGIELQQVNIIAQRPLIQKDNTNAIRTTTSDDIAALPKIGITNIIGLTSGVTISNDMIFIRGGRSDEVGYYLEGISVKNLMTNSNAVTLSQDALEEIQVQAGGYTAEFGGANAGIVRQQLKSGSQELKANFEFITDNIGLKSKKNAYEGTKTLGAYWWGYSETIGSISGPIFDKAKFFLNVDYLYNKDPNPQPYPGINLGTVGSSINGAAPYDTIQNLYYPAGPRKGVQSHSTTFTGTLNYDLNPILLRLTGTYSSFVSDAGGGLPGNTSDNIATRSSLLNNRLGEQDINNGSFSLKLTHIINSDIYYEIAGGYYLRNQETYDRALGSDYWNYGDSTVNAAHGWTIPRASYDYDHYNSANFGNDFEGRALVIDEYFRFDQNGFVPVNYSKSDQRSFTLNGALTINIEKVHSFKIGGEFQQYTIRNWSIGNTRGLTKNLNTLINNPDNAGKSVDQLKNDVLTNLGVNNYGYDVLGNTFDGDGFNAPHKPILASAYIQDKIEFSDLIMNLGLRFDHFDIDNLVFKDPAYPEAAISKANTNLDPNGFVKAAPFDAVSPRIGFSFPVTESSVFHAQYGKFVQLPQLSNVYEGYYSFTQKIRSAGNYYPTVTGPNLRPTRTTQYEIGFSQNLTDFINLDITGFYRDIRDQVIYSKQLLLEGSTFGSEYYKLGNGDFATTKGLEINLKMRRYQRVQASANISLQDARGTGSTSGSDAGLVFQPVANIVYAPKIVAPLTMNRPFSGNLAIDYRWGENDNPTILQDFGISAVLTFNSGHPYTLGYGNATAEFDQRNRYPLEALNASLTPSVFQVDMRIDKTVSIMDKLKLNIYVFIINLFDTKNVENVFLKTGAPADNGNIYTEEFQQKVAKYGQTYVDLYNALNLGYQLGYGGNGLGADNIYGRARLNTDNLYGTPRQIRIGLRLEY